jgi:hypothetical protein
MRILVRRFMKDFLPVRCVHRRRVAKCAECMAVFNGEARTERYMASAGRKSSDGSMNALETRMRARKERVEEYERVRAARGILPH